MDPSGIAPEPLLLHVGIKLLGPQQAREALPHYVLRVWVRIAWDDPRIKLISLELACREHAIKVAGEGGRAAGHFGQLAAA